MKRATDIAANSHEKINKKRVVLSPVERPAATADTGQPNVNHPIKAP
jgi:hypothetical protein